MPMIFADATPVERPAWSEIPIISTSMFIGIGRVMLILNSSVVDMNPLGTRVDTAQAIALSSTVPYHQP